MRKLLTILILSCAVFAQAQIKVEVPLTRTLAINGVPFDNADSIFVNMYDGSIAPVLSGNYNNVNIATNNSAFSSYLNYTDGTASTIRMQFLTNTESSGAIAGYNDNTQAYANNNATFFNDTMLRSTAYTTTLYANDNKIKLTGCDDAKSYDIILLFTRNTVTDRDMYCFIGADTSATINIRNNYTTLISFTGKSSSSGVININMHWNDDFCILAGYLIIEYTT